MKYLKLKFFNDSNIFFFNRIKNIKLLVFFTLNLSILTIINSQNIKSCGDFPSHQALSTNRDSIYVDRFGNTYDIYEKKQQLQTTHEIIGGYFKITFDGDPSYDNVIQKVCEELTLLYPRRNNYNKCGQLIGQADVLVNIVMSTNEEPYKLEPYELAAGSPYWYPYRYNKCNSPLNISEVNLTINSGKGKFGVGFDGLIILNSTINWHLDYDTPPIIGSFTYDFKSVLLHEFLHLYGFTSLVKSDGSGTVPIGYDIYDNYLYSFDLDGTNPKKVIIGNCIQNCWVINPLIPDYNNLLINNCTLNATQKVGLGLPLIAPVSGLNNYPPGTKFVNFASHLNSQCITPNVAFVMDPFLNIDTRKDIITREENEILCKLGYITNNCEGCFLAVYDEDLNTDNIDCCTKIFSVCKNSQLTIKINDLICNDISSSDLQLTDYFHKYGNNLSIQLINNDLIISGNTSGYYEIGYTIKSCSGECKQLNGFFPIIIYECQNCAQIPPCDNLVCTNGFSEFENGYAVDVVKSLCDEYWVFDYGETSENSPDICINNGNKYIQMYSDRGYLEGLIFKLQQGVDPGCLINISMKAATTTTTTQLNIIGSSFRPCNILESKIKLGCTTNNCAYDPECLSNISIDNVVLPFAEFCPDNFNWVTYNTSFINNTGKILNYILIYLEPNLTWDNWAYLDDIVITKNCLPNPDFQFTINSCDASFIGNPDISGINYSWNFGDGTTGGGRVLNHTYLMSGTYNVILTIEDECGNTKTVQHSITVNCSLPPNCNCQNNCTQIGDNGTITKVNNNGTILPNFFFGCYNICGTLDVNQNFNISIATLNMGPGSKIIVRSGVTLNIALSDLQGCNTMWQGIILEQGAHISLVLATISDAEYAIDCHGNVSFDICIGSIFRNNYVGIHAPSGGTKNISTPIFSGNLFDFTGFKPFFVGQSPVPQTRTFAGIEINNSIMVLNSGTNVFNDLQNGILAYGSLIKVSKCNFNRMGLPIPALTCNLIHLLTTPNGIAIFGKNSLLVVDDNNIDIAVAGIVADNCYLKATNNDPIIHCSDGIVSLNCAKGDQIIDNNNIVEFGIRGISLVDPITANPVITNNSISKSEIIQGGACPPTGIFISNFHSGANGQIENNFPINITGDSRGIFIDNSTNLGVQGNEIYITNAKTVSGSEIGGIIVRFSNNNRFYSNIVEGFNHTQNEAFSLLNGTGNKYCCNSSNNTFSGFNFGGSCNPTQLRGSLIHTHNTGLYISIGEIGRQPDYGNEWLNTPVGVNAKHVFNLNGFPKTLDSKFIVGVCSTDFWPTSFFPSQNTCSVLLNDWFNEGDPSIGCPISFCTPLIFPKIPFGGGGSNDDAINDDNDYMIIQRSDSNEIYGWESKTNLMLRLLTHSDLLGTDPTIDAFYFANVNNRLGRFASLEKLMYYTNPLNENLINQVDISLNQINDKLKTLDSLQLLYPLAGNSYDSTAISQLKIITQNALTINYEDANNSYIQSEDVYLDYLDSLVLLNNVLDPSNIIQNNIKELNDIILHTIGRGINTFTSIQTNTLFEIANQCPFVGGRSVGIARILYSYYNSYVFNDSLLCSNIQPIVSSSEALKAKDFEVFPNPSDNGFNITIPKMFNESILNLELLNIDKIAIKTQINLNSKDISNHFIDTKNLQSGVYFLIIRERDNIIFTKKLIFQK